MKDIRKLHRAAMEFAKQAKKALAEQDETTFTELTVQALNLEREAALDLIDDLNSEPTRSVLFRSAASLAFNIGEFHEAVGLTQQGLSGTPPTALKMELQELNERAANALSAETSRKEFFEAMYNEIQSQGLPVTVETKDENIFPVDDPKIVVLRRLKEFVSRDWYAAGYERGMHHHSYLAFNDDIGLISRQLHSIFTEITDLFQEMVLAADIDLYNAGPMEELRSVAAIKRQYLNAQLDLYRELAQKDIVNDDVPEFQQILSSYSRGFNDGLRVFLNTQGGLL